MLPCLLFEDEHLLVIDKPAGLNTHAPAPYAGQGLFEWLRDRDPRWASLAIIHRLDKDTSGVILFAKTPLACRSMTDQFARRQVRKRYVLLTDRTPPAGPITVRTGLVRSGDHYSARSGRAAGPMAETRFRPLGEAGGGRNRVEAEPLTGRTHQIRVHAQAKGFPILGDTLYGGSAAPRLCLHAASLSFTHPATGAEMTLEAPAGFSRDPRLALRTALIDPLETNAFRLVHGAADGWPGWFVDRLGDWLLSQSAGPLAPRQAERLSGLAREFASRGVYHKTLNRHVRGTGNESSPALLQGEPAPDRFTVLENGVRFGLSFAEGYSVGLFLDQRENRRRLLTGQVTEGFNLTPAGTPATRAVLNAFAYTCGFSVCAALAGCQAVSLDLSKKYLAWGRENFALNGREPKDADFIYGDVFQWLRRLEKKNRRFDIVLLDPPTFSQSREHGVFRSERDFGKLARSALPLVNPGGTLFCSTNAADWPPAEFTAAVLDSARAAQRQVLRHYYVPQPPDFPATREEPAYLKTLWLQLA